VLELPLFLFGLFVTLLVIIGGLLAIMEMRKSHVPMEPSKAVDPPSSAKSPGSPGQF
jgi:hypothetical protein